MSLRKHIPNIITSVSLLCGAAGVIFAFSGRLDRAFYLMLAAAACDFLDGFAARLLHAYSPMGKELDSLADLVSFGVLPAMMLVNLKAAVSFGFPPIAWVPAILVLFTALRLARYNVEESGPQYFAGLPAPSCGLICGSLCYFISFEPASFLSLWVLNDWFIPALTVVLCALLVSRVPMFSAKFSLKDPVSVNRKRIAFAVDLVLIVAIVAATGLNWSMVILLGLVTYVVMNLILAALKV
ncbi:MAG: CDP-diacylglycerol--serine O-phosphatidyltransferase [Bacteroidales bacterium]|jgi:CDP-diacylglycerol--serine O-phosphatidyltransferase|nr:CDP-diacylglycerol--serine O-phosphatidyltransferase [Bacteroidales bacterium]MBQ2502673.1 CDP-diacylglycerol--serine O-phosphatidyltransferase [Bacteroidales bacterium]MBQ3975969.1 CDP-diacylglycerol--serine O-phosphatidyltransferase [Bacteroidales bacterium]MBQ3983943.1 CDP-diacylglycerol--serine O-phosphatidyltransferase [Bacteroidales bacterium]MBQ4189319.1 CDP-diacylglycerol--serine O-phosphatidyltransferase [Bacteroidales bacterium]